MQEVRIGVIGVGGMGTNHALKIHDGQVPNAKLVAVCDIDPKALEKWNDKKGVAQWDDSAALIRSGDVDAVLIATPHYAHTTIGADALGNGLHVLVEKPISVHKADCERLIAAHTDKKLVFAAMFNQRTNPVFRKVKDMIERGELGEITRVNWIITNWFRTKAYYESGGWRATWEGEGGGVLLNQCPHQLDLVQWLCGLPVRVTAIASLGKRRNIEVEDEVSALFEYENGATGVFVTCVTEAPGTNRLEICGEMGKLVVDENTITFTRNESPMTEYAMETDSRFGTPPVWNVDVPANGPNPAHLGIMKNFVDAIVNGAELIAPAEEGIRSVELGNAMLYSGVTRQPVDLPMDGAVFEEFLKKLINESTFKKETVETAKNDLDGSFG